MCAAYRWVGEGICWEVALAAVELRPNDAPLVSVTYLEAAVGSPHAAATGAQLIKLHQQLKIWGVQGAPAQGFTTHS